MKVTEGEEENHGKWLAAGVGTAAGWHCPPGQLGTGLGSPLGSSPLQAEARLRLGPVSWPGVGASPPCLLGSGVRFEGSAPDTRGGERVGRGPAAAVNGRSPVPEARPPGRGRVGMRRQRGSRLLCPSGEDRTGGHAASGPVREALRAPKSL